MNKAILSPFYLGLLFLSACNGSSTSEDSLYQIINVDAAYAASSTSVKNFPKRSKGDAEQGETLSYQPVELILLSPSSELLEPLTKVQWQQTAGPQVEFLASNSKTIAFTPVQAGSYSFSVSFTDGVDGGEDVVQILNHSFTVQAQQSVINIRLGHAALEGNKVSLRAEITDNIEPNSLSWKQLSGSPVNLSATGLGLFFDAPEVDQDTIYTFQLSGDMAGETYSDTVSVLIEDTTPIKHNAYFDSRVARTTPYMTTSPFAETLVSCVYNNQISQSCTFEQLPLIAHNSEDVNQVPTIDDIMDRVVVSHTWMGDRLKQFLENDDPNNDFKNMLRATTAIVISYDVRPSFYWANTGAIYLDANNFWLTPDERDTINEAPDFRSDFSNELQFIMPWRYVKDNAYASQSYAISSRSNRSTSDRLYSLAALLYHELAHANDFFPKDSWSGYDPQQSILDNVLSRASNWESDKLALSYPLLGEEMYGLAEVSFKGDIASDLQKSYLPADVSNFFEPQHAIDFYNYSSKHEDFAMLFEALMMQERYNLVRDVAVINQPTGDTVSASDYVVDWGERGRIGHAEIKPRIAFVAEHVLPEFDSATAVANLPEPIAMIAGDAWHETLTISPTSSISKTGIAPLEAKQYNKNSALENVLNDFKRRPVHIRSVPHTN